jgi:hypothetical protein
MPGRYLRTSLALVGCALFSCSTGSGDSTSGETGDGTTPGTAATGAGPAVPGTGSSPTPPGVAGESSVRTGAPADSNGTGNVAPGVLTAGTWDDNRNYDFFTNYRKAQFSVQSPGLLTVPESAHAAAHSEFSLPPTAKTTLDVSLVIDTTGSMADEIHYLQSEFIALSSTIGLRYPNAEQHWSLVLYRDIGDEYVVKWFDFRADLLDFQDKLNLARADGGGDFPEAPDQALAKAADLSWRATAGTARLAFWVADAPHHPEKAAAMSAAISALHQRAVHVYPVASSGVDELTELTMRSAAQLTGGRYLFLTNDSGVGGDHKEPSLPCYFVTKLDRAILRMVDIEMSGQYREPDADEVLRTGGKPLDGACTLETGQVVAAY